MQPLDTFTLALALMGCGLAAAVKPTGNPDSTWTECDDEDICTEYSQWEYKSGSNSVVDGSQLYLNSNSNADYNSITNDDDNYESNAHNYYGQTCCDCNSNSDNWNLSLGYEPASAPSMAIGSGPSGGFVSGGYNGDISGSGHGQSGSGGNLLGNIAQLPGEIIDDVLGAGSSSGSGRVGLGFSGNLYGRGSS